MKYASAAAASLLLSSQLAAQNVSIVGSITKEIPASSNARSVNVAPPQEISLMKIELSEQGRDYLSQQVQNLQTHSKQFALTASTAQSAVDLGMNNTPVLNQGSHGSCVTFATTAALDAALGKGDYISQLCQLELGAYLADNGYATSGWEGTWGRFLLGQIDSFGFINKDKQKRYGCGGLTDYPTNNPNIGTAMSLESFHPLSEPLDSSKITWSPVLDVYDAFTGNMDANRTLTEVKQALNAGDRVTFGVLLLDFDKGVMGAVGTYKQKFDTWVISQDIADDLKNNPEFGGHEMVIIGYDDNAVSVDDKKVSHRGLLKLRNSWSDRIGDKGNFYMSYDYFKLLVIEAQRIKKMK
ncbi:C1 family peptidase [Legionella sp. 16cNR16C]|uniref:C1 family peptidase n=1 Tax=Legionella sp. 16cNR16C TaxID=2905656 RepID=UPI001E44C1F1|nr:C1 family peptidase [Legionella sp. 16cNR16C]MCE3043476.1 C1 family peptidase [Legionella sp. 16cNR16C]